MCGWGTSVNSRMYLNRGRWIDSERATAVCPFISGVHGRAQQWQLIHQPQGYYWASWNRTKNHLYPSCITSLLFSLIFLSTCFVEFFFLVLLVCERVFGCWQVAKAQLSCVWEKRLDIKREVQEIVLVDRETKSDNPRDMKKIKVKGQGVKQKWEWQ